jgi:hypothetical protein
MSEAIGNVRGGLRAFGSAYSLHRYAILFYTLLLTMAAAPLLTALGRSGSLIDLFLALSLLAAVMPLGTPRNRNLLITLLLLVWLARSATAWLDHPLLSAVTLGMSTGIGLLAAASALRFAMRATRVDAEHLYAALSAYLLAGIFFGLFYWVLEQIWSGSFAAPSEFSRMSALYFSFVTLATLGYGDITPRSEVARGLTIVEGVGGQLFLAVMVARLVSLYSQRTPATNMETSADANREIAKNDPRIIAELQNTGGE